MQQHIIILIIILTLGFFACNSTVNQQEKNIEEFTSIDSISSLDTQTTEIIEQNNDCIRGQAEPIIRNEIYPNTTFVLQPDGITAIETVFLNNGNKLIIRNWGCEYYVLTFRFETTKFEQDTTNLEYWFKTANRLMTGMLSGINAPIDIKRGLVFLDNYILRAEKHKFKNLELGYEIDFDGNEIRSFLSVDRIEKITDKRFAVIISFATGPL